MSGGKRGIDHFRILGNELELACNGGSCRGNIIKKRQTPFAFEKTPRINLLLQASYFNFQVSLITACLV